MISKLDSGIKYHKITQEWCLLSYPNHPKGCPNYGRKNRSLNGIRKDLQERVIRECPPTGRLVDSIFDLSKPAYLIWTEFALGERAEELSKNPNLFTWPMRYNIRYWQGQARAMLYDEVERFLDSYTDTIVDLTPEAHGLYVYVEMKKILGQSLPFGHWPPGHSLENVVYQVCMGGYKNNAGGDI